MRQSKDAGRAGEGGRCEEGQRSLPYLEEVTSKLRPKRQLKAGESQVGERVGIPGRGHMEQTEARGSAVHFHNSEYFSLAEGVEFKRCSVCKGHGLIIKGL